MPAFDPIVNLTADLTTRDNVTDVRVYRALNPAGRPSFRVGFTYTNPLVETTIDVMVESTSRLDLCAKVEKVLDTLSPRVGTFV